MASPPPPAPQPSPRCPGAITAYSRTAAVNPMCRAADQARLRPHFSCSRNISALFAMGIERLGNDAHVYDPRLLYRIHDGGESSEGNIFVCTNEYGLALRITHFLPQLGANLIDVDGIVAQKYALLLIDADHHPLFRDLLDSPRLGHTDFNAGLQHRRRDHKDDEQHENNVHEWRDVDIGEGSLRASVGSRKGHYRRTSAGSR